jgi:hypothetical protein
MNVPVKPDTLSVDQIKSTTLWDSRPLMEKINELLHVLHDGKLLTEEAEKLMWELDDFLYPVYCPTCNSCGEDGCCPPDCCKTVQERLTRLYCDGNWASYKELEEENQKLANENERLRQQCDGLEHDLAQLRQLVRSN